MENKTKEELKAEREKERAEYWSDFNRRVRDIMIYESACADFVSYLEKNGTKGESHGESVGIWYILLRALYQYKYKDDGIYARLKALHSAIHVSDSPKFTDKAFINNITIIKSFSDNCDFCFDSIKSSGDGMAILDVISDDETNVEDRLILTNMLLNHFETRIDYLKLVRNEIIKENTEGVDGILNQTK
ncbi:MAG: hypothetical protein ACLQQ4_12735 [Bacteroidia bacterium]